MNGTTNYTVGQRKNFLQRITHCELCLGIVVTIAILFILCFYYFEFTTSGSEKCESVGCMKSATQIIDFIDPSIDPCDDFHAFACGNFMKTAHKEHTNNPLSAEAKRAKRDLDSLILAPPNEKDPLPILMQKKFFESCLKVEEIDADGDETFFNLFEQIGGWPLMKGRLWNPLDFDWMSVMVKCQQLGLPFQWFLSIDLHKDQINYLKITRPKICYLTDQTALDLNLMIDIAEELSVSRIFAMKELDKVLRFEQHLQEICLKGIDEELQVENITQLQAEYPKYHWLEFINNITDGGKEFFEDSEIAYDIVDFVTKLDHLLIRTNKRVQANYIGWKIIEQFAPFLSNPIREIYENATKKPSEDRMKLCLHTTQSQFLYVSEAEYARRIMTPEKKEKAAAMMNSIRTQLYHHIKSANWIDEISKQFYLDYLQRTEPIIGGNDEIFDEEFFNSNYLHINKLNFTSENIVVMITEKAISYYRSMFESIDGKAIDPSYENYYEHLVNVNALFDGFLNKILLPAAIFEGSMFNDKLPDYLNYATLGFIMGHEITHGIYIYDSFYNYPNDISTETQLNLIEQQNCLIEDYAQIESGEDNGRNGSLIVEENYADIVGRDLSYEAYNMQTERYGEELPLLNLPYTARQLFWIRSTFLFCYEKVIDLEDPFKDDTVHASAEVRNNAALRNSKYFAHDFNCAPGSFMNPEKKCLVL